ncbi:hypothetical protein DM01DRAFT_1334965 [Hesseltinella vesiculosa]|uniref:Uncharacterized protein n=1 Tax=Hesseltinella vesiculosa TaxID=101127 RepID=A0A1X2GL25_9FUNG|nr:hypothetical protein DM01DRAFT_1334965 [Hesseltinella vesiculosa]
MPPAATRPSTLGERITKLMQTLQFPWFVGHCLTLLGTFFYVLSFITFHPSAKPYKIAYLGAIISYGVVIIKTHGKPQLTQAYAMRLFSDENMQYLILSLFWFVSKPVEVSLIPFATFSLFHALGYVRQNIIPVMFPVPRSSNNSPATWQANTQQRIKAWTGDNYSTAMRFVATAEVTIIMPWLILGLFKLRFMPIFLYSHFLRIRYHMSTYSRQAFAELRQTLDHTLLPPTANPRIPAAVSQAYTTIKAMAIKFTEAAVQQAPAPQ